MNARQLAVALGPRLALPLVLAAGTVACSGCASMIDGSTQQITIRSEPDGAEIFFMGESVGSTPATLSVKRIPNAEVRLRKQGYKDANLTLKAVTNPKIWYNAVFFLSTYGIPSTLTDLTNGSFYQYMPDRYFATLEKAGDSAFIQDRRRSDTLRFALVNNVRLIDEIHRGEGDYLNALFDVSGVTEFGARERAVVVLRHLAAHDTDSVDFARAVAVNLCGDSPLAN